MDVAYCEVLEFSVYIYLIYTVQVIAMVISLTVH